jgi:hypothetical protein
MSLNLEEILAQAELICKDVKTTCVTSKSKEKRTKNEEKEWQELRLIVTPRLSFLRTVSHASKVGLIKLEDEEAEKIFGAIALQNIQELVVPNNFDLTTIQQWVNSYDFAEFENNNSIKEKNACNYS